MAILDVAGEEVAFEGATEAEASVEAGDSAPEAEQDVAKNEDSQSCPTNSFAPHTLVLLANGQLIAIDKVKVGDAVEAFDTKTGKRRAERVTKVWINHDTDLLDLTFSVHGHSYELDTTQHHPFWDARTHSWVEAENLKQGTILATNTRATSQVTRSKVMTTTALMWDLTVALDHDFYVTVRSASTAVLVHNCPNYEERNGEGIPKTSDLGKVMEGGGRITRSLTRISERLDKYFGVTQQQVSERIHVFDRLVSGNPDFIFTPNGDVYDSMSGDYIGSLLDE